MFLITNTISKCRRYDWMEIVRIIKLIHITIIKVIIYHQWDLSYKPVWIGTDKWNNVWESDKHHDKHGHLLATFLKSGGIYFVILNKTGMLIRYCMHLINLYFFISDLFCCADCRSTSSYKSSSQNCRENTFYFGIP